MIHSSKKRNTPIVTLIKNFVNKRSGRVTESREEIQRRFDYLDWKYQKKIILAFLDSGKKDRQWAYSKTLEYWDKSFEPKVQELWERLHEEKAHGQLSVISPKNIYLIILISLRRIEITILFA